MKTMSDYVWEHGFIMGLIVMFWVMTVSFFYTLVFFCCTELWGLSMISNPNHPPAHQIRRQL